jgi:hypothetical protein
MHSKIIYALVWTDRTFHHWLQNYCAILPLGGSSVHDKKTAFSINRHFVSHGLQLTTHTIFGNLVYSNAFLCVIMSLRTSTLLQCGKNAVVLCQRPRQRKTNCVHPYRHIVHWLHHIFATPNTAYAYLMFIVHTIKTFTNRIMRFVCHKQKSTQQILLHNRHRNIYHNHYEPHTSASVDNSLLTDQNRYRTQPNVSEKFRICVSNGLW